MDETIQDRLVKMSDMLHYLGKYQDANMLRDVCRILQAQGIRNETQLQSLRMKVERECFKQEGDDDDGEVGVS